MMKIHLSLDPAVLRTVQFFSCAKILLNVLKYGSGKRKCRGREGYERENILRGIIGTISGSEYSGTAQARPSGKEKLEKG
jgi:hypothetical protein